MSLIKKILLIILAIVILVVVVQVVNAAKYKMIVSVVAGDNVVGINPLNENLDFGDLSRSNGMTRYVTMKNNGKMEIRVIAVKFGEISDLVKLDKSDFTLKPGEEVKLAFEIQIPPSAEVKKYSGYTIIFRLPKLW